MAKVIKHFSVLFFFLISLGLVTTTAVFADYQSSRLAFQTEYTQYRQILVDYQIARSEYLTYKTLVSRSQAIYSTKQFLNSRQRVMLSYLDMLEQRLLLAKNDLLTEGEFAVLQKSIEDTRLLLEQRQLAIDNAQELEDLANISSVIDPIINQVTQLGYLLQGRVVNTRAREMLATAIDLVSVANEQVNRIGKEGKKDTSEIERWLIDAQQKLDLAQQTYDKAEQMLPRVRSSSDLDNYRSQVRRSQQYIKETNKLLLEIINSIKLK